MRYVQYEGKDEMPASTYWSYVYHDKIRKAIKKHIEALDTIKEHKATWVANDINRLVTETLNIGAGVYRAVDLGLDPDVYRSNLNNATPETRAYESSKCHVILEYLFMNNDSYYEQYDLDKAECKNMREAR